MKKMSDIILREPTNETMYCPECKKEAFKLKKDGGCDCHECIDIDTGEIYGLNGRKRLISKK